MFIKWKKNHLYLIKVKFGIIALLVAMRYQLFYWKYYSK